MGIRWRIDDVTAALSSVDPIGYRPAWMKAMQGARLDLRHGFGPVTFGSSRQDIRARLGAPSQLSTDKERERWMYRYMSWNLYAEFDLLTDSLKTISLWPILQAKTHAEAPWPSLDAEVVEKMVREFGIPWKVIGEVSTEICPLASIRDVNVPTGDLDLRGGKMVMLDQHNENAQIVLVADYCSANGKLSSLMVSWKALDKK
jgi:hypothetical protein